MTLHEATDTPPPYSVMVDERTNSLQVGDGDGAAVTIISSVPVPVPVSTSSSSSSTSGVHRDVLESADVGSEENRSRNRSVTETERERGVKSSGGNGTAAARTLKGLAVKNVSQQGIDFISS